MSLLDELRGEGRLDARGTFDLDPEEAREKLRKYQLTHPEKYILQFVQAAIVLGAEKLVFDIDSDEVDLRFGGESLSREHLEDIFVHAFGRTTDRRMQAAKHLALGMIAAEGVDPAVIEIEAAGDDAIRLRIEGEHATVEDADIEINRIYLRERARVEHLKEFVSRAPFIHTRYREPETLKACRYALVPILVNRSLIATGRGLKPDSSRRVELVDNPTERGFLRFDAATRKPGSLTLIKNGVIIEETHLELGDFAFEAVIETDRLATNLSYTGFVRNDAREELLDEVLIPAACQLFLRNTTRALYQTSRPLMADFTNGLLESRTRLLQRYREPPAVLTHTLMHMADAEIWRLGAGITSLARALHVAGEGAIYYTTVSYPGIEATDESGRSLVDYFVIERSDFGLGDPRLLASATGRRLVDITSQLQERHRKRIVEQGGSLRLRDGLKARWPHELPDSVFERPVVLDEGTHAVSVGFDPRSSLRVARFFVKAGIRPVEKVYRDIPALGGLTFSVAAREAESVAAALQESAHLIARAVERYLAVSWPIVGDRQSWLPHALASLLVGTFATEIGDEFGRSDLKPILFRKSCIDRHRIFESLDGEWKNAGELGKPVEYVPASSRTRAVQIVYEAELLGRDGIVWLDRARRSILETVRGKEALRDVEEELAVQAGRIQRERGGFEEDAILHGSYLLKRSLSGGERRRPPGEDGAPTSSSARPRRALREESSSSLSEQQTRPVVEGEIGLTSRWTTSPGAIDLVVLHQRKRLATRRLATPHGHFRAVVDGGVQPTEDLGDLVEDQDYEALVSRLESVAGAMFERYASSRIEDPDRLEGSEELVLWQALADSVQQDAHPHRLRWRVFATNEGMKSYRDLESRSRVYGTEPSDGAIRIDLPAVPGPRLDLLAEIFGDEVQETRRRNEPAALTREVGPGPLQPLRRELARLAPELEFELEDGEDSLRFIASRFALGREHSDVRVLERHPERAALLLAIWAEPGSVAELV